MNTLLDKSPNTAAMSKEFGDTLALFYPGSSLPYAMRAPLDTPIPIIGKGNAEVFNNSNELNISVLNNCIYCGFGVFCSHIAVVTLDNTDDVSKRAEYLESYFREANKILSANINTNCNYLSVCELISKTAEYCGCLTDINLPAENEIPLSIYRYGEIGKSYSAVVALFTICLIFRRVSALRGFNFKLIFNKDRVSLAFSAKILAEGIESIKDLTEYPALEDLDLNGGVTMYYRLVNLTPEDGEEFLRLTVVLTLQAEDPRGILRAPEWKEKTRALLDDLDLDIPGRF